MIIGICQKILFHIFASKPRNSFIHSFIFYIQPIQIHVSQYKTCSQDEGKQEVQTHQVLPTVSSIVKQKQYESHGVSTCFTDFGTFWNVSFIQNNIWQPFSKFVDKWKYEIKIFIYNLVFALIYPIMSDWPRSG